tara:strand:- start:1740 stop:2822 length:1083 start_codon:yes stop_codon:yes gene_type:complete
MKKQERWIKPKAPVTVEFYDPQTRKYSYIDELEEVPSKKTIQRIFVPTYGPGKYRVIDASPEPQTQVWSVAEDLRADHALAEAEEAPMAPRGPSQEEITERAVAAAMERMNRYRPPAPPSYAPQAHAPAPVAHSAGPDPYTADILRRVDTAMHQIQSQVMNLENQLSRMMFEVQQVPTRVGIDVRAAVQDAGDPEERVANLWAMLQDMQEGNIVGEDSTPGWLKSIGTAAAAFAQNGAPPSLAQMQAGNGQAGAPALPSPQPFGVLSDIEGIDAERAEAIAYLCQMLNQPIELAPKLATMYGMNADQLIEWGKEQVRAAQENKQEDPINAEHTDGNRPGAGASEERRDPDGAEMGEKAGV